MSQTRNDTYKWLKQHGLDSKSRVKMYKKACVLGEFTRRELAWVMWPNGVKEPQPFFEINQVCGRVNELCASGAIYVKRHIKCPETGRKVELLAVNRRIKQRYESVSKRLESMK